MNINNKTILITGGTGSFGSTAIKAFLKDNPKKIIIFSRDEKKQHDLREKFSNKKLTFVIGDIRDSKSILNASRSADYIFHAAALKQVPTCEFYPMEAIKTNILGTDNVINACIQNNVRALVVLSTDKAVYPINAMGISKAMMEKNAISYSRNDYISSKLKISVTRYGNVIGSRGSVIPYFFSLAYKKKPLPVTNPNMTRFMTSLDDSVDLVKFGLFNKENGNIYVKKAKSCKIYDLALVINEIMKSRAGINLIGSRHGEKMHENLLSSEEMENSFDEGDYFRVPIDSRDLNYSKYFSKGVQNSGSAESYSSNNTEILKKNELRDFLMKNNQIKELIKFYKK